MAQAVRGGGAQGRSVLIIADTIVAVSSGRPPAAIAVVRISGPAAVAAATALAGSLPPPRRAALRALRQDGELLDRALVLLFPGPASATGENLVELHCHGGRAVVEGVEQALCVIPDVRRAEPGEFTRRALLNGRIDLTEAEGLADLLEAETETQRRAALAATEGRVSRAIRGWMDRVSMLSARIEAAIDYAEDGDAEIEAVSLAGVTADQRVLADDIGAVLAAPPVERWRDGIRVVIAGPPNAGKSTLINLLSGRDAAIVSPIAGTTRDRIEVAVRRRGIGYVLIDTAGLHDTSSDTIEAAGMTRAREVMASADLVVWMGDDAPETTGEVLWIHGRADLYGRNILPPGRALAVSAHHALSLEALWELIAQTTYQGGAIDLPLHEREWAACRDARDALAVSEHDPVLLAEQLRAAHRHLAQVLGLNATEQMLDSLFSRFCLGK